MSVSTPPVRGLVAGKYEVLDLIGRGGMGSVWQGRHASLGTRVAIKFVDPEHAQSHEARSRFVTEARAAATIQSKHAIQIYDHGVTDDGRPYIVMELLLGEPLDRRIERVGRLSLAETARILGQVCRALQRAHDAGIIHRDLKPENIFLVRSPDDDEETAKVLDFGIAKIMATPGVQAATSSTRTGAVLGTPYYMSPEQARGLRNIDHRTDLWSLGVIAYKCVTGALPFEGESVGDLLVNICTGPVPSPSAAGAQVPKAFETWFFRTMEREPAKRFSQASELASALALAAGLSVRRPGSSQDDATFGPHHEGARDGGSGRAAQSGDGSAAGITSAPFTASPRPARPPRRALFVVSAALVGGAIGVIGVIKIVSAPQSPATPATMGVESAAPRPSAPPSASIVLAPSPAPAASLSIAVPSATSRTQRPTAASTTTPAEGASAANPANTLATGSPATPGPGKAQARPVGRSAPTASGPISVKTATPKPSPTEADPGY
jgi:serine/threonine protein kinase